MSAERTVMTVGPDGRVLTIRIIAEPDTSRRLWGWKEISSHLRMSERWAKKLAAGANPMPIAKVGRSVTSTVMELHHWVNSFKSK